MIAAADLSRGAAASAPSPARVLLAGVATLGRRTPALPRLPDALLVRRDVAIDADAVAAYRTLCGYIPEQGVPPAFAHLIAFPLHLRLMMARGFPYPLAGLVHIANRIVQHAPLAAGDRIDLGVRAGGWRKHPRGQAFTIEASGVRDGAVVWASESTYLRLGVHDQRGPAVAAPPGDPARMTPVCAIPVPRSVARDYARLSGDRNPIHMSWLGARLFGFPRPIAHGMWTKGRALAGLLLPGGPDALTIDVAFRAPILLPGRVALTARVEQGATDFAVTAPGGERLHLLGRIAPGTSPSSFREADHA